MEDSNWYAGISKIIKQKLDAEKNFKVGPFGRGVTRAIRAKEDEQP